MLSQRPSQRSTTIATDSIHIKVLYLGGSRAEAGCREEPLQVPRGTTVRQLATLVGERHPKLERWLGSCRWSVNFEFAGDESTLKPGDEVGLLPPVAGGAPRAVLTDQTIDPAALLPESTDHSCGATVLFVGTVRDHARGKAVVRLEYEAYEGMAVRQLEIIIDQCQSAHEGVRLRIAHRHGSLAIGDVSVAISASSPHRQQAFAACRMAIERIKEDVPIWKHEFAADGETWVGWGGG